MSRDSCVIQAAFYEQSPACIPNKQLSSCFVTMDSDDNDTSSLPDQYARDNHLSIDFQVDPFLFIFQINDSVPQLTPDAGPGGLTSDGSLPLLHLPALELRDELEIPEDYSNQVDQALQNHNVDLPSNFGMPLAQYEARKRLLDLKFDLPALSSDPDYDLREWARNVEGQRRPALDPNMFPPERLNIAGDEGLKFPPSVSRFREKLDRIVLREKLDVPKGAIHHLVRALRDDWSDNERCQLLDNAILYQPFVRDLVMTPPLSPCAEHEEHFIPKARVCEVPIASDPASMLSDDIRAAESAILDEDFTHDLSPNFNVGTSPVLDIPAVGASRPKVSSFRIESPMLPLTSPFRSPNTPHVDMPALLKNLDFDHILSHLNPPEINVPDSSSTSDALDPSIETVMKDSATAIRHYVEQEQISIADAVARVQVPILDFSIPEPKWQSLAMDYRVHLVWLYKYYSVAIPLCPREPRLDSKLRWIPFLEKINLNELTQEAFDCGISLPELINSSDNDMVATSENYIWKRPGLAILREPDSEDCQVEPSLSGAKPDLASLAKKRRFETGMEFCFSPSSNQSIDPVVPFKQTRPLRPAPLGDLADRKKVLPSTESDLAVSVLLHNYIDIRSAKRRKQDRSAFFLPTPGAQAEVGPTHNRGDHYVPHRALKSSRRETSLPCPCPEMPIPSQPTKLIKGLTLSRKLFSMVENNYPAADIIERDFNRWETATRKASAVSKPYNDPPLEAEADIIISPATGVIVTTLLKAIQKPVSPEAAQSSIRGRIASVALRYEKLIVLVSEGNTIDETVRKLMPSETLAYGEFIAFVAGLDSHVEVFYVGGGEVTLAKWLLSFVYRYAPEATEIQKHLVQDETTWEVFLRRMGFNAYAAQAIIVRLEARRGDGGKEDGCNKHGLPAFIMMSDTERIQTFRDFMGGETVLKRVNWMLSRKWR